MARPADDSMKKGSAAAAGACPSCGAAGLKVFHRAAGVPANSCILLDTQAEAAAYPRGDISLAICPGCGFITNAAYEPGLTEYSQKYEETQGFSPTFNAFQQDLAESLVARHGLRGKDIVEIGCGKGEFLSLLCRIGPNRGVGYDPAYVVERDDGRSDAAGKAGGRVTFVRDFYSDDYAKSGADFIVCKMTLEHIPAAGAFLSMIRRLAGVRKSSVVFIQVPDATRILEDCAFEDVYYEHCSYFSPGSLGRLFRRCGLDVDRVETVYDGQYIVIEGRPGSGKAPLLPPEDDLDRLRGLSRAFRDAVATKAAQWRTRLKELKEKGRRAVIWGSGSKGVAFLTTLGVQDEIACAVDVNPFRHGHYMPGSGHRIAGREFLKDFRPDAVIVMNRVYCDEIRRDLRNLGIAAELMTI